jgi:membrane-associated phospholipid phosphatase
MHKNAIAPRPQPVSRLHHVAPLIAMLAFSFALGLQAQTAPAPDVSNTASLPDAPPPQPSPQDDATVRNVPRNFLHDQAAIWASPARVRTPDLKWLLPLAAATGVAIATDHYAMTNVVSKNPGFNQANLNASNAMIYSLVAAPVALYGFGRFEQDEHARETGVLAAEAMLDGVVVEQGLKLVFWQERPYQDNAKGKFFQSSAGVDSAFPSSHSVIAFAAASALAAEYPNPWVQALLYTGAGGVAITRVLGQDHFPSDVLVGSACGWLIGHYVVRKHSRTLGAYPTLHLRNGSWKGHSMTSTNY